MKSVNKLLKRKKSKIGTAAKVLLPVAGVIAAKKLWDNKETLISEDMRSKVLEKTEAVQDKVQKFHDFIQNPEAEIFEETTEAGEETDVINEEITEEIVEQPEEINEEIEAETEAGEKESENL